MLKLLFGLIQPLHLISFDFVVLSHQKILTPTITEICIKRKVLEQQHHINYVANKNLYRNWLEVNENPKHDCQRFLRKIYRKNKRIDVVNAEIRKVILNYNHIRDENNNMLTPQRVTALECRLSAVVYRRKFIFFIRSPQSPKCALFLNRIRKRSYNFYIVEEVCEHKEYAALLSYIKNLEENETNKNKFSEYGHQIMQLPDEKIRGKHAELEKKHYDYCSIHAEICKSWPEVQIFPEYSCQRFLRRMLPEGQDLSSVIAKSHRLALQYFEIKDENTGIIDPVIINAIACQLPQPIQKHKHIYFIRAPSFPNCVFYGIRKMMGTQNFYITEEICDTPNHKIFLKTILLEQKKGHLDGSARSKQKRYRRQMLLLPDEEVKAKRGELEKRHYEYCSVNIEMCKLWSEVRTVSEYDCQRFLKKLLSESQDLSLVTASLHQMILHYLELRNENDGSLNPVVVNAVTCQLPKPIQRRTHVYFIRAPSYPTCVFYGVKEETLTRQLYITEEICDTPNYSASLHTIFFEHGKRSKFRKREQYGCEPLVKVQLYEELHFQNYSINRTEYVQWPVLRETDITPYCQTLMEIITSDITKINEIEKFIAVAKSVKLKYATLNIPSNETILPIKVKALECTIVSKRLQTNRFWFIKTPNTNNCVYRIRRRQGEKYFYFIAGEICQDNVGFVEVKEEIKFVDGDESSKIKLPF